MANTEVAMAVLLSKVVPLHKVVIQANNREDIPRKAAMVGNNRVLIQASRAVMDNLLNSQVGMGVLRSREGIRLRRVGMASLLRRRDIRWHRVSSEAVKV
jgi:hypothetical protein